MGEPSTCEALSSISHAETTRHHGTCLWVSFHRLEHEAHRDCDFLGLSKYSGLAPSRGGGGGAAGSAGLVLWHCPSLQPGRKERSYPRPQAPVWLWVQEYSLRPRLVFAFAFVLACPLQLPKLWATDLNEGIMANLAIVQAFGMCKQPKT